MSGRRIVPIRVPNLQSKVSSDAVSLNVFGVDYDIRQNEVLSSARTRQKLFAAYIHDPCLADATDERR